MTHLTAVETDRLAALLEAVTRAIQAAHPDGLGGWRVPAEPWADLWSAWAAFRTYRRPGE